MTQFNKIRTFTEMTRVPSHFLPISLLSVATVSNTIPPSTPLLKSSIITNPHFQVSFVMVQLLSGLSMVINDIWDVDSDRINHPHRPLVTGRISMRDVQRFSLTISALYIFLGIRFLPQLAHIWAISFVTICAYTPILKKITLIKNVACASVISAAVPFIGFSVSLSQRNDFGLWRLAHFTFLWSMFLELMMDILDKRGDANAGIPTVPVLYGNTVTIGAMCSFLFLSQMYFIRLHPPSAWIHFVFYYFLWQIEETGFDRKKIHLTCKYITYTLLCIAFFLR
jgi:geranylgeranylglycerol-phosphate geranylgeranyltransferase